MKFMNHHCEPLQAAVHTGRMPYDVAIEKAYFYGHKLKEGLNVDHVVSEAPASERSALPKLAHHCEPLKKLVADGRMHGDKAIEAAYKLGVEERSELPKSEVKAAVEEAPAEVEEKAEAKKPVRKRKKAEDEEQ